MADVTMEPVPPKAAAAPQTPSPASIPLPPTPAKTPVAASKNPAAAAAVAPATPVTPARTRSSTTTSPRSSAALARARETAGKAQELMNVARDRAADIRRHPTAARVEAVASKQVDNAREILGRSESIRRAEQLTGIDRVPLVLIGASLFTLLVPFNVLGLALPVTTALALAGPSYQAVNALDRNDEQAVKNILIYFVVFGLVQTIESLMGGFLERALPRYHTIKLLVLAYLSHSQWRGAEKLHSLVFKKRAAPATPQKKATTNFNAVTPDEETDDGPSYGKFATAAGRNGYPQL